MPPPQRSRQGSPDYDVVALSVPIVYSLDGDHDPDGLMFALARHAPGCWSGSTSGGTSTTTTSPTCTAVVS